MQTKDLSIYSKSSIDSDTSSPTGSMAAPAPRKRRTNITIITKCPDTPRPDTPRPNTLYPITPPNTPTIPPLVVHPHTMSCEICRKSKISRCLRDYIYSKNHLSYISPQKSYYELQSLEVTDISMLGHAPQKSY